MWDKPIVIDTQGDVGINSNFALHDGETLDLTYESTEGWVA